MLSSQGMQIPIQVAYDISHPDTREREFKGLIKAAHFLKADSGILVTLNEEQTLEQEGIRIQPAWQFVMNLPNPLLQFSG